MKQPTFVHTLSKLQRYRVEPDDSNGHVRTVIHHDMRIEITRHDPREGEKILPQPLRVRCKRLLNRRVQELVLCHPEGVFDIRVLRMVAQDIDDRPMF